MQQPQASKKIYLINRDFQLRYTGIAVVVGVVTTLLSIFVILAPLYMFEILRIPRFLPTPMLVAMSTVLFLNVGALCFMGIVVTHRIAGPMYAIVRHLRRLAAGKFNQMMRIRDEDELKYVVRNINDLTESLQNRTQIEIAKISNALDHIKKLDASNPDVAVVKTYLEEAEAALNYHLNNSFSDEE